MQQLSKQTKLLTQQVKSLISNFANFSTSQMVALIISLPYLVWRTFIPKNNKRSHPVSRFFRKIFEFKKTRQMIGVDLAILLAISTILQGSVIATELKSEQPELTTIAVDTDLVTTETTFRQPVAGYVSQQFTWYHPAIDIAGNQNSLVYPIAAGKITVIETSQWGYGMSVVIEHDNQISSRYAHLRDINVKMGQEVAKNTVLGHVGSTGWSTGPHLHLEVYEQDQAIDPLAVLPDEYLMSYISLSTPNVLVASDKVLPDETEAKLATFSAQISSGELKN